MADSGRLIPILMLYSSLSNPDEVILALRQLECFCAMQHEDQTHLDVGGEKSGKR